MAATQSGRVYVGKYIPGAKIESGPNRSRSILIHTSTKTFGGSLSPYQLRDEHGHLLENVWQFSKVCREVSAQSTALTRWTPDTIIWSHPAEQHVVGSTVQPAYWKWRTKGMANSYAVRYPNGFAGRTQCLCSLWPTDNNRGTVKDPDGQLYEQLDYISARKKIYCGLYFRLVASNWEFIELRTLLANGTDLHLVEVDGPNVEWYRNSSIADAIVERSLVISEATIRYLVNDPSHPFGHGYVIAALLLGGGEWMVCE